MSHVQENLTEWFLQAVFVAALLHLALYVPFFRWQETVTGRSLVILSAAIVGTLFHAVLMIWGFVKPGVDSGIGNDFLTWLGVVSLGAAALAMSLLALQAVRYLCAESDNMLICKMLCLGRKITR